jgi:hypothetical protein
MDAGEDALIYTRTPLGAQSPVKIFSNSSRIFSARPAVSSAADRDILCQDIIFGL